MRTKEEILKEKLDYKIAIVNNPNYTFNKVLEAMEVASDEQSVAFAEWFIKQDITGRGVGLFVNHIGEIKTTSQLLEIYKKEQQ